MFNLTGVSSWKKFVLATRRFLRDEEGVTAIEYGLIASLIAVMIIAGATLVGEQLIPFPLH